jgi:nitrous oxidase accessory protein
MFSDSCQYLDNAFVRNGAGVAVMYARFVVMERNTFERNRGTATYGLLLKDIRDSRISGNRFIGNTVGLLADGSNRLAVKANTFRENGWAIKVLANATDNRFTDNVFVGNTFDVATNSRRSSSSFERNYWDAYRGYDLDGDGFGDVPFRPVRLFSLIVERYPTALSLLRSLFIDILDAAERVLPLLTPETLVDAEPRMGLP